MFRFSLKLNNSWFWLVFFPIIFWQCYSYVGLGTVVPKVLMFVVSLVFLLLYSNTIVKSLYSKHSYRKYIAWIVVFFLSSLFVSFFYWHQSMLLTFRAGAPFLVVLYFFLLDKKKYSMEKILKLIFVLAILYFMLWCYAVWMSPFVVFGNLDEVSTDRGFSRIMLRSLDVVCLLYFIALVKVFENKNKIFWLFVVLFSFMLIFFSLSRMLIFSLCCVTFFFLFRRHFFMSILLVPLLLFVGFKAVKQNQIASILFAMTENQFKYDAASNLRGNEYEGLFRFFPVNPVTMLLGNGTPHVQSSYGQREERLKWSYGFNRSDSGYVDIFVTYGLLMLLVLAILFFKVMNQSVDLQYVPFKLFIIFLYITNITSSNFSLFGVSFMISLYVLESQRQKNNKINNINQINC